MCAPRLGQVLGCSTLNGATEPAWPDRQNEDFYLASPEVVVLIDGAGTPPGSETGCTHGVAWFARRLGGAMFAAAHSPDLDLVESLRTAIADVAAVHADTCDLAHPGTPSATVTMVRVRDAELEYLALADSVLVLEHDSGVEAITDTRIADLERRYRPDVDATAFGSPEQAEAIRTYNRRLRAHRNQPGGFWVASSRADAADQAVTGAVPLPDLRTVSLLSDGASWLVDTFGVVDWAGLVRILRSRGPAALIADVREQERADPDGRRFPRGKIHDDATAVLGTVQTGLVRPVR